LRDAKTHLQPGDVQTVVSGEPIISIVGVVADSQRSADYAAAIVAGVVGRAAGVPTTSAVIGVAGEIGTLAVGTTPVGAYVATLSTVISIGKIINTCASATTEVVGTAVAAGSAVVLIALKVSAYTLTASRARPAIIPANATVLRVV
jgi:hypothetical protein